MSSSEEENEREFFKLKLKSGTEDSAVSAIDKCLHLLNSIQDSSLLFLLDSLLFYFLHEANASQEKRQEKLESIFDIALSRIGVNSNERDQVHHLRMQWMLFQIMKKYNLKINERTVNELDLKLLLINGDIRYADEVFPLLRNGDISERLLMNLRNVVSANPYFAEVVLNKFTSLLSIGYMKQAKAYTTFSFLVTQCLIHATKANSSGTLALLNIISDDDLKSMDNFVLRDIVLHFEVAKQDLQELEAYYAAVVGRSTYKLVQKLMHTRWDCEKGQFTNSVFVILHQNSQMKMKNCFLMAVMEKKHFLNEVINADMVVYSSVPNRLRMLYLLHKLYHPSNLRFDPTEWSKLIAELQNCASSSDETCTHADVVLEVLVNNLNWIFNFINWCIGKKPSINAENLRSNIFQNFANGDSPLEILHKYGLLCTISYCDGLEIQQDVSRLLTEHKNQSELMLWYGFVAVKLGMTFITNSISPEDCVEFEDIANEMMDVLKKIYPLPFRVEIIENLFSLLFVTVRHLTNEKDEVDSDGYNESTISNTGRNSDTFDVSTIETKPTTMDSSASFANNVFLCNSSVDFIFPSDLVPKYLDVLKEASIEAESALYSYQRQINDSKDKITGIENLNVKSSIANTEECKTRLKTLKAHIIDAKWRYTVIEPTLTKPTTNSHILDENITTIVSDFEEMTDFEFWKESITPNLNRQSERDVSVIPCMLASADQLLRYCLLEGKIEKAEQLYSLFEGSLLKSEEACELFIVKQTQQFHAKLKLLTARKCEASGKTVKLAELAAKGLERSEVVAALHEFYHTLSTHKVWNIDCRNLSVDFALSLCPTVALSQVLLEVTFQRGTSNDSLHEKLMPFFKAVTTTIAALAEDETSKNLPLSSLVSSICNEHFFNKPQAFKEQKEKLDHLKTAVQNVYVLLKEDSSTESDGSMVAQSTGANTRRLLFEYEKLLRHCPFEKCQYLRALFFHVRKVSKALAECRKRGETMGKDIGFQHDASSNVGNNTYFSVLYQSPSVILCSMVLKQDISPKIIDDLARDMKVDLLGTLCTLLCPSVPATYITENEMDFRLSESVHPSLCEMIRCYHTGSQSHSDSIFVANHFEEEENAMLNGSQSEGKICNSELVEYFRCKSVILVETLKLLQLIDPSVLRRSNFDTVLKCTSPLTAWIEVVKKIFGGYAKVDSVDLTALALHPKLTASHPLVMKVLERLALRQELHKMYDIILYLDSRNIDRSFISLKTAILNELTRETGNIKFALQIDDEKTKVDLVLELIFKSDVYLDVTAAARALKSVMSSLDVSLEATQTSPIQEKLETSLKMVTCYSKIGQLSGLRSWRNAYESLSTVDILTILKTKKMHSLVVEWDKVRPDEEVLDVETNELRLELLALSASEKKDANLIKQAFVQSTQVTVLVDKLMQQIEDFDAKNFLLTMIIENKYLESHASKLEEMKKYILGITLIRYLAPAKRLHYMTLAKAPELILEQMLMNVEFGALERSIKAEKLIKCDSLVEKYAKKAITVDVVDTLSVAGSDTTMISSTILADASQPNFIMPLTVPTVEQWVPDFRVSSCMLCKVERFSMFNRRHHCRRCGRVVCANCSKNVLVIPEITALSNVRVCDDCYLQTRAKSPRKESLTTFPAKFRTVEWLLSPNESENETIREEFYYESSPSCSLCLSILRLHTDRRQCINIMVENFCRPLFDHLSSNQVDYGLIIDMIKSLLMSAKLLVTDSDVDLLSKIDLYLGRVDIIKMLVNENCLERELISCVINADNAFLKLQEKLIETERFELALLMGMKFGLNLKPIWKTWALVCLRNMKLMEARAKYKHCFVTKSKGEGNVINSKLLDEIFEIFEKLKQKPSTQSLKDRCKAIRSGNVAMKVNNAGALPDLLFEEAYFYLNAYGTKEDLIKFFLRFDMYKEAVEAFISESHVQSLSSTFVSVLMIPSLNKGCLKKVLGIIHSVDPTLSKTWKYLLAACKYFSVNNFFSVLHTIQTFMGDYIRAAITQIHYFFLQPPASDYNQLYTRLSHLQQAKQHCRDYLKNVDHLHKGCYIMEAAEVSKQIKTIDLQIDITTKFHEKNVKGFPVIQEYEENSKSTSPPTLLDHSKSRKTQLASLVAVEWSTIAEGLALSQQIVKDHNLDAAQVFRFAGRILVSRRNVKDLGQFLDCIRACYLPEESVSLCDDIVGSCLRSCTNPELTEPLIKMLTSEVSKIDAYIKCGKLKSAYLLAVKLERVVDVKNIHALAVRTNQENMRKISEMWLNKYEGINNEIT